jgi:hypothetical protein
MNWDRIQGHWTQAIGRGRGDEEATPARPTDDGAAAVAPYRRLLSPIERYGVAKDEAATTGPDGHHLGGRSGSHSR